MPATKRTGSKPSFNNVFIRKSVTPERSKDKELRRRAFELNGDKYNGDKVYVVYKGQISALLEKRRLWLVYRPPCSPITRDDRLLSIFFELVTTTPMEVTVVGDFNLSMDWDQQNQVTLLLLDLDLFVTLGIQQYVHLPAGQDNNMDFVLSSRGSVSDVCILPLRDFLACNKMAIYPRLVYINWLALFNECADVNDVYTAFAPCSKQLYVDQFVPHKCKESRHADISTPRIKSNGTKTWLFSLYNDPLNTPAYLDTCKKLVEYIKLIHLTI
ncbi:hypothetical protein COOONC_17967 [Cooperia oncophora]